jgi:hypothetical protein
MISVDNHEVIDILLAARSALAAADARRTYIDFKSDWKVHVLDAIDYYADHLRNGGRTSLDRIADALEKMAGARLYETEPVVKDLPLPH